MSRPSRRRLRGCRGSRAAPRPCSALRPRSRRGGRPGWEAPRRRSPGDTPGSPRDGARDRGRGTATGDGRERHRRHSGREGGHAAGARGERGISPGPLGELELSRHPAPAMTMLPGKGGPPAPERLDGDRFLEEEAPSRVRPNGDAGHVPREQCRRRASPLPGGRAPFPSRRGTGTAGISAPWSRSSIRFMSPLRADRSSTRRGGSSPRRRPRRRSRTRASGCESIAIVPSWT